MSLPGSQGLFLGDNLLVRRAKGPAKDVAFIN